MTRKYCSLFAIALLLFTPSKNVFAQPKTTTDSPIQIGTDGKLSYKVQPNGDRVPDYSYCGYMFSEQPIPNIPVKVIVPVTKGDATGKIQAAIDYVSSLPLDKNGFRGAILLEKGTYVVGGSINIRTSGVVLRGSGCNKEGTTLLATGIDRETLIKIRGVNDRRVEKPVPLADVYFPVNATTLNFKTKHDFKVGDEIIVNRPSTKEWVEKIGADKIGIYVDYQLTKWDAGDFDQNWYRKVVAVMPETITLDVPLTNSLDPQYGGGKVAKYTWDGLIKNVGVENIRCISSYYTSNTKDENHRWMAITLDNVRDAWIRRVVAEHFVSSAVAVWETASRVTVEDCKSLAPVGEIGNHRRYSFHTIGQQVLFQRCYAEYSYHAFSVGFTAPGPNAFVQCYSYWPYNFSGAIGGWATGVLFDKVTVDGGNVSFAYRDVDGQGGGWSAANSLSWQTRAAKLYLDSPPGAQNWAYGSWAQGYGNGQHELPRSFLKPESIFYTQLKARTSKGSPEEEKILIYESDRTTAPSPQLAAQLSQRSKTPDTTLNEWIDKMIAKYPIVSDLSGAKNSNQLQLKVVGSAMQKAPAIAIKNGWIVRGNAVLTGRRTRTTMWRGTTRPSEIATAAPNLVRFVPGRIGKGLTDDLDTVANNMLQNNIVMLESFPALWYERRRDDHARTRRADADVWTPFYEQPFSRSGQGEAYDRLSKYDLTKWNTWYWLRLKRFTDLADEKGLLYIQEHYLQHNIIEEGAHWADYPWRTANNINNSGFPEPPAYAGDKRVYMAEQFYDITHPVRKRLHRAYIRKSLDNFKGNTNIIHHLGIEYTGPLHFVQFWLDVISEWEKENHQKVLVMLPGTKDVQDAILTNPKYSALVDAIDVLQWHYRKDGSLYAPVGGQSIATRQYARILDVGETSFAQIYRAVNEFHNKYPDKAILYSREGVKFSNWAVFMGSGSLATLPPIQDKRFFEDAAKMERLLTKNLDTLQFVLGKKGTGYIIFSESKKVKIDLSDDKDSYELRWINPSSGEIIHDKKMIEGGKLIEVEGAMESGVVVWLVKK